MDGTCGTYADDKCFDIHDDDTGDDTDDDTNDDTDDDTDDGGAGTEDRSREGPNSYLR